MTGSRRNFIKTSLMSGAALQLGVMASDQAQAASGVKYRKIAVEESFMLPEVNQAFMKFAQSDAGLRAGFPYMEKYYKDLLPVWGQRGIDMGAGRIQQMDENGIDMQVMSMSGGALSEMEPETATSLARLVNDRLAEAVAANPDRFAGLASLAPQNPAGAVKELERAVNSLGMKGAIITSHVQGEYMDDKKFWDIFATAEALDVPIYLHPTLPSPQILQPYLDYGLVGPMAGFNAETSIHALRLIMCGLFDQFPKLQMVLGHCGEGIPFFLSRIDRAATNTAAHREPLLKRLPSEYFLDNFVITTSGLNDPRVVEFCITMLGAENVLFAIDYPYESMAPDATALDDMNLPPATMEAIFSGNSERVFKLAAKG